MLNAGPLDHAWIARHIPHQGSMCLLDAVTAWDEQHIECRAVSHRALDNPLRAHGRLGAACGIEYAAQAMAVHGALAASAGSERPRLGYLVSVRGTQVYCERLDNIRDDLHVKAVCALRDTNNIVYDFSIYAGSKRLLQGRATVVLNADTRDATGAAR